MKGLYMILLGVVSFTVTAMGQTNNNFPATGDANVGATEILNNSYANPLKPGLRSSGDRFLFYNNASYKTAIGMLNENGLYMQAQGAASSPLLQLWSGTEAGGNISAKYTFTIGGNVGIGTLNPLNLLSLQTSTNQGLLLTDPNNNNRGSFLYDGVQSLLIQALSGPGGTDQATMKFQTADINGAVHTRMSIMRDGNVGIGIGSPTDKLAVNGNIRAHEIKVETANWPDYVFAKDYELPTLQETEKHIKDKGHLPGIPSAAEVKANGVDLGEMNAKLLQKIEELTLHLIEQNKKMDVMQKENQNIKSDYQKLKRMVLENKSKRD